MTRKINLNWGVKEEKKNNHYEGEWQIDYSYDSTSPYSYAAEFVPSGTISSGSACIPTCGSASSDSFTINTTPTLRHQHYKNGKWVIDSMASEINKEIDNQIISELKKWKWLK